MPSSPEKWVLAALLIFTLLVRGGVLYVMRGKLQDDPDEYREIAENLLRHGEFALGKSTATDPEYQPRPTAYRPPLYPIVLSNLPTADGQQVSLAKVAALHLLLGLATVWLTWLTARRVGCAHHPESSAGIAGPTIAGLIVACDPILLNQQSLIMTETLAAFLAILSLWCLARFDAARSWFNAGLAGGAIGLAALCRPTFLPWLGLVGTGMLVVGRRPNCKLAIANWKSAIVSRLGNAAALFLVAGLVMSPWAIRNYRVFGKPMLTTTHGGYTLLLGNNRWFFDWLITGHEGLPWAASELVMPSLNMIDRVNASSPNGSPIFIASHDEVKMDKFEYQMALQTIRAKPAVFGYACLYRVSQLWSPLPHKLTLDESTGRRLLRYATCAWYYGVYVLAAVGIWRLRSMVLTPPWIWGVLLCFAFTAVHTFYWTNLRMRAPLMPFVAIVAGAGFPRRLCFSITNDAKSYAKA